MVQVAASSAARHGAPAPPVLAPMPRRPLLSRFSGAHALMLSSGLLAFVLMAVLLGRRDDTVAVAVARADIAPGVAIAAAQVRWAEVPADSDLVGGLVSPAALASGEWVASDAIESGQPLRRGDLRDAGKSDGLRLVSIPVPREHAAGGALRPGDRVDVIDVVDGRASFVVAGVEVASVGAGESGRGLTGGSAREFFVVVRADAHQALAVASALADGKLELVASTGATPVVVLAQSIVLPQPVVLPEPVVLAEPVAPAGP